MPADAPSNSNNMPSGAPVREPDMKWILALLVICTSFVHAEDSADEGYSLPPGFDLDHDFIDPGITIKIVLYDKAHHRYEVQQVEDPTILKMYATANQLAKAVPSINLRVLKELPESIVGREFDLENILILED